MAHCATSVLTCERDRLRAGVEQVGRARGSKEVSPHGFARVGRTSCAAEPSTFHRPPLHSPIPTQSHHVPTKHTRRNRRTPNHAQSPSEPWSDPPAGPAAGFLRAPSAGRPSLRRRTRGPGPAAGRRAEVRGRSAVGESCSGRSSRLVSHAADSPRIATPTRPGARDLKIDDRQLKARCIRDGALTGGSLLFLSHQTSRPAHSLTHSACATLRLTALCRPALIPP